MDERQRSARTRSDGRSLSTAEHGAAATLVGLLLTSEAHVLRPGLHLRATQVVSSPPSFPRTDVFRFASSRLHLRSSFPPARDAKAPPWLRPTCLRFVRFGPPPFLARREETPPFGSRRGEKKLLGSRWPAAGRGRVRLGGGGKRGGDEGGARRKDGDGDVQGGTRGNRGKRTCRVLRRRPAPAAAGWSGPSGHLRKAAHAVRIGEVWRGTGSSRHQELRAQIRQRSKGRTRAVLRKRARGSSAADPSSPRRIPRLGAGVRSRRRSKTRRTWRRYGQRTRSTRVRVVVQWTRGLSKITRAIGCSARRDHLRTRQRGGGLCTSAPQAMAIAAEHRHRAACVGRPARQPRLSRASRGKKRTCTRFVHAQRTARTASAGRRFGAPPTRGLATDACRRSHPTKQPHPQKSVRNAVEGGARTFGTRSRTFQTTAHPLLSQSYGVHGFGRTRAGGADGDQHRARRSATCSWHRCVRNHSLWDGAAQHRLFGSSVGRHPVRHATWRGAQRARSRPVGRRSRSRSVRVRLAASRSIWHHRHEPHRRTRGGFVLGARLFARSFAGSVHGIGRDPFHASIPRRTCGRLLRLAAHRRGRAASRTHAWQATGEVGGSGGNVARGGVELTQVGPEPSSDVLGSDPGVIVPLTRDSDGQPPSGRFDSEYENARKKTAMKTSRPMMEELKGDENRVQGRRRYYVWSTAFEVEDKYVLTRPVGRGAYGVVCAAKDLRTGETRAVKKISQVFLNLTDAKRTIREVKLLRHLRHKNVICIHDIMMPIDPANLRDLYVVYELMDTDLYQVLKSKQELTDEHTQYFIYQVVCALYFIHSANVIHRDLKPSNLVLNTSCELKICDFGLARPHTDVGDMTQYVVTRWYRAPELLIGCEEYTSAIDVWSTGCILGELLLGKPLFEGRDYMHQLRLIIGTLGTPSEEDLDFIEDSKILDYIQKLPHTNRTRFSTLLPRANPLALELLECMLVFHPSRRCTMAEAMAHPYFAAYHKESDAVRAEQPIEQDFSCEGCDEKGLRQLLMEEIQLYHPEPLHKKVTLNQVYPGKWRKLDINKAG